MKKCRHWLIFPTLILAILSFFFSTQALAQTTNPINAGILASVWYSATIINENDTINIYAGFQNSSDQNLSGTATFYVDDKEINKVNFTSSPKSLIRLESKYVAIAGSHTTQIKILNINNLLANVTEKKDLQVQYKITQQAVVSTLTNVGNSVVAAGNGYAENLASYVENLKNPPEGTAVNVTDTLNTLANTGSNAVADAGGATVTPGEVLGESIVNPATIKTGIKAFPFYNPFLDILAFLIRQWKWILGIILFFILYSMLRRKH